MTKRKTPRRRLGPNAGDARCVPGAREFLRKEFLRTGVDPRTGRMGHFEQVALDQLEAGESITIDAWELEGAAWEQFGGRYARLKVDVGDVCTVIGAVDGPLDVPGGGL